MTDTTSANKRIAKNTLFLYIRMLIIMSVTLYTSRVILEILGITDYGIYQVVGGIVGFLAFLNVALSTGTSRFITFDLGRNNEDTLSKTFITSVNVHILLALVIAVLGELIGLWLIHNKLKIPPALIHSAIIAFHWSIMTVVFSVITVPYNADIISHERMNIFAYIGIAEAFTKLGIVYLLKFSESSRLELYAFLLFCIQFLLFLWYLIYCTKNFKECSYRFYIDWKKFKEIASFSGWSLFSSSGIALNNQGILILLNIFFSPAVVTARTISLQVNNAVNQFVNNFRTAVNPQIVKLYAAGEQEKSRHLLLNSTKYSYYLMLLLCLPLGLLAKPILSLWLKEVPEYTVPFLQLVLIQSLIQVFDNSFYTALYAKGQLKQNALLSPLFLFIMFPIVFILFKLGFSPLALSWAAVVTFAIIAFIVKPILIIKLVNYTWKDIRSVILPCIKVSLCALPLPIISVYSLNESFWDYILIGIVSFISVSLSIYLIGIDSDIRKTIIKTIKTRIFNPQ